VNDVSLNDIVGHNGEVVIDPEKYVLNVMVQIFRYVYIILEFKHDTVKLIFIEI